MLFAYSTISIGRADWFRHISPLLNDIYTRKRMEWRRQNPEIDYKAKCEKEEV